MNEAQREAAANADAQQIAEYLQTIPAICWASALAAASRWASFISALLGVCEPMT